MKFNFTIFSSLKSLSDDALLARMHSEPNRVVSVLMSRYADMLSLSAMRYLKSTDASKEVVVLCFEKLVQHKAPETITSLQSWLFAICRNLCLNILRKKQNLSLSEVEIPEEVDERSEGEIETLSWHQVDALIAEVLSEQQAQCIRAFYMDKMTYNEIASAMNKPVKWVKSNIQNGKRNLVLARKKQAI